MISHQPSRTVETIPRPSTHSTNKDTEWTKVGQFTCEFLKNRIQCSMWFTDADAIVILHTFSCVNCTSRLCLYTVYPLLFTMSSNRHCLHMLLPLVVPRGLSQFRDTCFHRAYHHQTDVITAQITHKEIKSKNV